MLNTVTVKSGKNFEYYKYGKITQPVLPNFVDIGPDTSLTATSGAYNPYWISVRLSANTALSSGQPIPFDTLEGGNLTLNNPTITLEPNKTYYCLAFINDSVNSSGTTFYRMYNATTSSYFENVIAPSVSTNIQVRAIGDVTVMSEGTNLFIQSF